MNKDKLCVSVQYTLQKGKFGFWKATNLFTFRSPASATWVITPKRSTKYFKPFLLIFSNVHRHSPLKIMRSPCLVGTWNLSIQPRWTSLSSEINNSVSVEWVLNLKLIRIMFKNSTWCGYNFIFYCIIYTYSVAVSAINFKTSAIFYF